MLLKPTNPISVLLTVASVGGRLEAKDGSILATLPRSGLPPGFKDEIRQQKPALISLLTGPPFIMVQSAHLGAEVLFWTGTDEGRNLLVIAGADPGCVYTLAELSVLIRGNPSPADLINIHLAKRIFAGCIHHLQR